MKVKTKHQLFLEMKDLIERSEHLPTEEFVETIREFDSKWVSLEELKQYIDNLRTSNDMWRKPVDSVFNDLLEQLEGE